MLIPNMYCMMCKHISPLQYQYRDRAKELRDKYGRSEAIIPAWKKKIDKELSEDAPVP